MRVTTSVTDDAIGFDGLRAVVGAGEGVVGRFPGIVCVAHCSDPEPLRVFLAVCADIAGPEPGRALARRLATWMSGPEAPGPQLRFGTIATAGDQLAVYLVGDVDARVDTVGGLALSGAHAAIGTDRLLPRPVSPIVLSLGGGEVRADPADVHDLRAGVVPGAGVLLRPTGSDLDDLDRADEGAAAGHEWFDTGEATSDPLAGPQRAQGVPAQRAAGTEVGGRNGAARAAEPEATAERGEPPATASGRAANGRYAAPTVEPRTEPDDHLDGWSDRGPVAGPEHEPSAAWIDRPDPGVRPFEWLDPEPVIGSDGWGAADSANGTPAGRHALEAPAAPVEERATRDTPIDPPADTLGDPLPSDAPALDPLVGHPADLRGAEPEWPDPRGDGSHALAPRAEAAAPTGPNAMNGAEAMNGAGPGSGAGLVGPSSADPLPVRSRSANAQAWPAEPELAPTAAPTQAPTPQQLPATSLFAPDRDATPGPGSAVEPVAGPVAPGGFAAAPEGAPGPTRPPPSPAPPTPEPPTPASPTPEPPPEPATPEPPTAARPPGFGTPSPDLAPTAPPDDHDAASSGIDPSPDAPAPRPFDRVAAAAAWPPGVEETDTPSGSLFLAGVEAPTDVAERTPAPADPGEAPGRGRGPRIRGYRCENGHLNDPRSPSCRECGAPIDERVGGLVAGPRPALGTLVFDDGAAHLVDGGYLIGRTPNVDERVRTGELRPIVVDDQAGSVSPAHAEIRVSGWDVLVIDNGSGNGTDVSGPDEGRWTALPPRRSRRLLPGTRVRLGARVFVFESSSTVR